MSFESLGAGMRRVGVWVLTALAAVLTFVVVYSVTVFLDRGPVSVTTQMDLVWKQVGLLVVADLFFGWVSRHIPTRRPKYALLDFLAQARVDSPEFTAAALEHFRRRSRLLSLVAASICLYGLVGLAVAFDEVPSHIPVAVLGSLCILLYGGARLRQEMGHLRALSGLASADETARSAGVRELAWESAGRSADDVSRAIWRRFEPAAPVSASAASVATPVSAT